MSPRLRKPGYPSKTARGFTVVSALFILVVLAALGSYILSVTTSQAIGSALDVQGVRAYEAARSGVEWGLHRQLRSSSCVASSSFVPAAPTLSGFTVTVTCVASADASGGPTSYTVTSTACNQPVGGNCPNTTTPTNVYLERRVDVKF